MPSPEGSETLQSSLRSRAASSRTCCIVLTLLENPFIWNWSRTWYKHTMSSYTYKKHDQWSEVCAFLPCCCHVSVCPDQRSVSGLHSSVCAGRYNLLSDPERDGRAGPPRADDPVQVEMEHETRCLLNCHNLNTTHPVYVRRLPTLDYTNVISHTENTDLVQDWSGLCASEQHLIY